MLRTVRATSGRAWLCGAAIAATGCASPATTFQSTWKNPAAAPARLEGQKVVALVVCADDAARRAAEDALARQIAARGAQGVAAWTLLPTADAPSEEKARAALAGSGAVGVVTMQVLGRQDAGEPRVDVRSAGYRSFWGNYRWSSQVAWTPGRPSGPQVWVETLVHSLDPDTLLWSGRSRTAESNEVTALFDEVAVAAAREMARAGLLRKAGS
jgi:hypothetical protein